MKVFEDYCISRWNFRIMIDVEQKLAKYHVQKIDRDKGSFEMIAKNLCTPTTGREKILKDLEMMTNKDQPWEIR